MLLILTVTQSVQGLWFCMVELLQLTDNAIEKLNGLLINVNQLYVGHFLRKQERETVMNETNFDNVFVKNLSKSIRDEDLMKIFVELWNITSAVVMRNADGKSKCFGFVIFENADAAAKAFEALNEKKFIDKE